MNNRSILASGGTKIAMKCIQHKACMLAIIDLHMLAVINIALIVMLITWP